MLIVPLGTNFCEILIAIQTFSFKKMHFENVVCEMAAIYLGLNVLTSFFTQKYHMQQPSNRFDVSLSKWHIYHKISNISRTKSQNLNDSCLVLHLPLPNLLKSDV